MLSLNNRLAAALGWVRTSALLCLACHLASPARAASNPLAAFFEASERFEALSAQAPTQGMPRLSDPAVAPHLRALTDVKGVLLDPAHQAADMPTLTQVCDKTSRVAMSYVLFEFETRVQQADEARMDEQLRKLTNENSYRFQDELAPVLAFNTHCVAVEIALLTQFMQGLSPEELADTGRFGLGRRRVGSLQMILGTLAAAADPMVRDENKALWLDAVAATAPAYASSLRSRERRQVLDWCERALTRAAPRFTGAIETIMAVMRDERCEGLCRL